MKKLLLVMGVLPVAAFAQVINPEVKAGNDISVTLKSGNAYVNENISPVRLGGKVYSKGPNAQSAAEMFPATQIGVTYYDLMTNAAMPRRVKLYPNGKVSVVWTSASDQDNNFPTRGTGYNHFDGKNWVGQNDARFEPERAGWPNLVTFMDGSTEKEVVVSHYAAGGTGESGGTFWQMNTGVGESDFQTFLTKDKPNGPLWPRTATTGNKLHMISVYQTNTTDNSNDVVKAGVRTPVVYYRYDLGTATMEADAITLPGYDDTRYGNSNADEYSIDARGDVVAIVIGGMANDVALYKSTDGGQNWTKTIVDTFAQAPFDAARKDHPTFGDHEFDTTSSNDGAVHVVLDNNNSAHVFYPRMRVLNNDPSDAGYSYFPGTNGIIHWSENHPTKQIVGFAKDMDGDGELNIRTGTTSTSAGSYTSALATFPVAAVDGKNDIFMVYSAPNENDVTADEETNYRDLFLVYSRDGGATWMPQDDSKQLNPYQLTGDPALEDVFPTVARDVDDALHLVWMRDEQPGIFLVNQIEIGNNQMMYRALDTADIFRGTVGIQKNMAPVFEIGNVYPNPAVNTVHIPVSMKNSAAVSVKMTDMMGKTILVQNNTMLPTGPNVLSLGVDKLSSGIYVCQITANGQSVTKKIVVK